MVRVAGYKSKGLGSRIPAKFRLDLGESLALCNSKCMNHKLYSHREEGPWHC